MKKYCYRCGTPTPHKKNWGKDTDEYIKVKDLLSGGLLSGVKVVSYECKYCGTKKVKK